MRKAFFSTISLITGTNLFTQNSKKMALTHERKVAILNFERVPIPQVNPSNFYSKRGTALNSGKALFYQKDAKP
ncbi:hypothetical protein [Cyclobacterium qasimii]|uniref:Uncharacterized protein n=2 Tax=Cyclobacterium qasimii TaxID=1350429 RepID=S7VJ83_9BACT|nr:hypothetical protein [Cyclobacterium qasimii]EPR69572.1 hypothetical protein ADICYQ_1357 [Cyclobacterium qasimii M12-11B]GEO21416.1 hypothetical protein CQA01_19500 [Cyclobacterium qasimii]